MILRLFAKYPGDEVEREWPKEFVSEKQARTYLDQYETWFGGSVTPVGDGGEFLVEFMEDPDLNYRLTLREVTAGASVEG